MATVEEIQKEILENLKSKLENQLKILESTKKLAKRNQTEIYSIIEQLDNVTKELETLDVNDLIANDSKLENLVSKSEVNQEAQESLRTQIDNLNQLKDQMNLAPAKKIMDIHIERAQKKLDSLQKSAVNLESRQRAILLKKQMTKTKREMLLSKQEAKVDYAIKGAADYEKLKNIIDGNSLGDRIHSKIADIAIRHYTKSAEKNKLILEVMQSNGVGLKGANAIIISKKTKDKLSNTMSNIKGSIEEMMPEATGQTLVEAQSKSI